MPGRGGRAEVANLIADGHGYIEPYTWQTQQLEMATAGHPPLWTGLLSLFSFAGLDSTDAHRMAGVLVGTAAVVLVGFWAGVSEARAPGCWPRASPPCTRSGSAPTAPA